MPTYKADYAELYEESQHNVMKLKNRLEELHSYAKDRESVLEQVQSSERRQAATLKEMSKVRSMVLVALCQVRKCAKWKKELPVLCPTGLCILNKSLQNC